MNRRKFIQNSLMASLAIKAEPILSATSFPKKDEVEKLVLLHTNDTHSRIEPFSSGKFKGLGGVSARMKLIEKIRSEEKNVLLVDAGDIFQGTPYFNLFNGEVEIKAMSMMGYDATTIGNHDFDSGMTNLATQLQYATFPMLVSNYVFKNSPLESKTKPYHIIKRGNLKIGLIGVGIELHGLVDKKLYGDTQYLDPSISVNKYAQILKNDEKCDLIILLSHLGYNYPNEKKVSDTSLAQTIENVDIIIGGHTHTFLDCPTIIKKNNEKFVIINQVGWAGITLGRLDIYFDKSTKKIVQNESNLLKCQV